MNGEVVDGFNVTAPGSTMTVTVNPGTAKIPYGTAPAVYGFLVAVDTSGGESLTVTTANGANPRKDLVVAYVDLAVTPSTATANNPNNMLKLAVVAGTPGASPSVPNTAAIQSAIGASNPYIIVGEILVGTGVTQITNNNITDRRVPVIVGTSRVLGYAEITSSFSTSSASAALVTNGSETLSIAVTVPPLRDDQYVEVEVFAPGLYNANAATLTSMTLWDGATASGMLLSYGYGIANGSASSSGSAKRVFRPTPGAHTFSVGLKTGNTSFAATIEATGAPAYLIAKVIG